MANTFTVLFRGAASQVGTTLYTTPADTTTLVTSIVVANTTDAGLAYNLSLGAVSIGSGVLVPANDSLILEVKQVMNAGDVIQGDAGVGVNFHISGLEIT